VFTACVEFVSGWQHARNYNRHIGLTGLGWIDGQKSPVFRCGKSGNPSPRYAWHRAVKIVDCGRLRVLGAFLLVSLYGKRHADWFIRAARELTDINDCTTGVSMLGFSSAESLRESSERCSLLYIDGDSSVFSDHLQTAVLRSVFLVY